jgi:OFA family oxalate/formate antiporter-like MFS transporter
MLGNPIGAYFQKRRSNKLILAGAATLSIAMVFISSYVETFILFALLYGVGFPFGVGLSYFTPLMCGWEWLPNRRGFVSGVILCGFGFGSFFFGFICMAIVNPDNVTPMPLEVGGEKLFPFDIAQKVMYSIYS